MNWLNLQIRRRNPGNLLLALLVLTWPGSGTLVTIGLVTVNFGWVVVAVVLFVLGNAAAFYVSNNHPDHQPYDR